MKAVFFKGSPPAGRDPLSNRAAAAVMAKAKALDWEMKAFPLWRPWTSSPAAAAFPAG